MEQFDAVKADSSESKMLFLTTFFIASLVFMMLMAFSTDPIILKNTTLILFFLLTAAIFYIAAMISDITPVDEWINGFGEGHGPIIGLILGAIGGLLMAVFFGTIPNSIASFSVQNADTIVDGLFTKFGSPIIEELFFRGLLTPVLIWFARGLNINELFGMGAGSAIFAIFHFSVFSGEISSLVGSFVFAMVMSLGVYYTRSLTFGIGGHIVLNTILSR